MKRTLLLSILLITAGHLFGQDSIRALNVFRHYINDGKVTNEKYVIEQQTFDLNDSVVLIIHYYDSVPKIKDFTRLYYDDKTGQLVSEETFSVDRKVLKVNRYAYDASGMLTSQKTYTPVKNMLQNSKTIEYKYSNGEKVGKIVRNEKGKWMEKQAIERTDSTKTILIKYHKRNPDHLKTETITKVFDGDQLIRKSSLKLYRDKHTETREVLYTYNEKGKLASESISLDGAPQERIEYSWYVNGTLNRVSTYDAEDNLIEYLSHSYIQHIVQLPDEPMLDLSKPLSH